MQKQIDISYILQSNRINFLLKGVVFFTLITSHYVGFGQIVYISKENPTIGVVLKEIEMSTKYRFFYDKTLDLSVVVILPTNTYDLNALLTKTFENTNYDFKIGRNIIAIKHNPKKDVARKQAAGQEDDYQPNRAPQRTLHVVSGTVRSLRTKEPIEDVAIMFSGDTPRETFSKKSGEFALTALPSGEYEITALHKGYNLKREKINISGLSSIYIELELEPRVVSDSSAKPHTSFSYQDNTEWLDASMLLHRPQMAQKTDLPKFALKTNLILWTTTSMNLGFEARLSDKMTFDLPVSWNPWTFANNKLLRHVMVQPEIRYWTRESFNGHFVGFNLTYAFFNVGNIKVPFGLLKGLKKYRYEGSLYGVGVSYGYQWMLSNNLSLEATVGLGYAYLNFDRFECQTCAPLIRRDSKHYVGLTKMGVSISYFLR